MAKLRLKQSSEEREYDKIRKNKGQEKQEKVGMQRSIGLPSKKLRKE